MKAITIIAIILSIGLISAIYPGDSLEVNLNELESYSNYTIEGNTSAINITINNLIAIIKIPTDYIPGEFNIIFNGYKEEKIIEQHYSSGGSGGCIYNQNYDWECSEWGECIDGITTRTCKEYNNCYNNYGRPNVTANCLISEEPIIVEPVINPIITIYPKSNQNLYIIIAMIIIGGIITTIVIIKRRRKVEKHDLYEKNKT